MTDPDAKLAAILIRGPVHVDQEIKDALNILRLRTKHACIVAAGTPTIKGMLKQCSNYITWGEISSEVLDALAKARTPVGQAITSFRLHPPRGGYERKGIKVPFSLGGALGYRGAAINNLITRML